VSQYNLKRIFNPGRVAVVGASETTGSIGNALMKNLIDGGFPKTLLPVNPKYKTLHGLAAYKSIRNLEPGFCTARSPFCLPFS
jgi:acetyltransferase